MSGTYVFLSFLAAGGLFALGYRLITWSDNRDRRKWLDQYRKELGE